MKWVIITAAVLGLAAGLQCGISTKGVNAAGLPCKYRAGRALPDSRCSPGSTDPAVKQTVEDSYIQARTAAARAIVCAPGRAARVRPPSSYTQPLKLVLMRRYGSVGSPAQYQLDHLIPLELGGAPRDISNLWPQPIGYAHTKDTVENALHRLVCDGVISLWVARGLIAIDWRAAGALAALEIGRAHV